MKKIESIQTFSPKLFVSNYVFWQLDALVEFFKIPNLDTNLFQGVNPIKVN